VSNGVTTTEALVQFENRVAEAFNAGMIRAPVHLSGGNEDRLAHIFKVISRNDWVFSTWRSHYHALLHGVDPGEMMRDILDGRSISLCYPKQRFFSSAIVGGCLPMATGVAWTIKRLGAHESVWVFVGDMAARTGVFSECYRYAAHNQLPIRFVIEDNHLSVCTNTDKAWGRGSNLAAEYPRAIHYSYTLKWPHSGAGQRVEF
jgi:TPP-dependent pyruvate/acetoin dehydrogenase alpha subunit